MTENKIFGVVISILISSFPSTAAAYIGPGTGISAIGTLIAFVGALLLAIVGFIWYPLKRLIAKFKKRAKDVPKESLD